jgi:hypothetical protein
VLEELGVFCLCFLSARFFFFDAFGEVVNLQLSLFLFRSGCTGEVFCLCGEVVSDGSCPSDSG